MVGAIEMVLAALNDAGVRYIVVGGVAAVLHGHLRTTADLDLVVELSPPAVRESWARDKGLTVFGLWSDRFAGLEVDLFVVEPFDFEATHARAVQVALDRTTATVISLGDLLDLKQAAGRPVDLADIEALRLLTAEAES